LSKSDFSRGNKIVPLRPVDSSEILLEERSRQNRLKAWSNNPSAGE